MIEVFHILLSYIISAIMQKTFDFEEVLAYAIRMFSSIIAEFTQLSKKVKNLYSSQTKLFREKKLFLVHDRVHSSKSSLRKGPFFKLQ